MFRALKDTYQKSAVAVFVQNMLEAQQNMNGLNIGDAAAISNRLISDIWEQEGEALSGRTGPKPHKLSIAAVALAQGMDVFEKGSNLHTACIFSLGILLTELDENRFQYSLNGVDLAIIDSTARMLMLSQYDGSVGDNV